MSWKLKFETLSKKHLIAIAIVFVLFAALAFGFIESEKYKLEVHESHFAFFNDGNSPLKIVHLSDFQSAHKNPEYMKKIISLSNAQNADLIVITGDLVEGFEGSEIVSDLSGLSAKYGVYAILGNHDYRYWRACPPSGENVRYTNELGGHLENLNITLLRNENAGLNISGRKFYLAGLDDSLVCMDDYDAAVLGIEGRDKIVLLHEPAKANHILFEGKNFVLSGHTHCGQVYVPYVSELFLGIFGFGNVAGGHVQIDGENQQFISCGLDPGIVRLFNPNTIDVLYLN